MPGSAAGVVLVLGPAELLAVDSRPAAAGSARPDLGPGSEPGSAVRSSGLVVAAAFAAFEARAESLELGRFAVGTVALGFAALMPRLVLVLVLELELGLASMLFEHVASVAVSSGFGLVGRDCLRGFVGSVEVPAAEARSAAPSSAPGYDDQHGSSYYSP